MSRPAVIKQAMRFIGRPFCLPASISMISENSPVILSTDKDNTRIDNVNVVSRCYRVLSSILIGRYHRMFCNKSMNINHIKYYICIYIYINNS